MVFPNYIQFYCGIDELVDIVEFIENNSGKKIN